MRTPSLLLTVLCVATISLQCLDATDDDYLSGPKKVTNILFYLHNTHSGKDPSSVLVAQNANATAHAQGFLPFSYVYVYNDLLTEGPSSKSKVVGNAQGMYASTAKDGNTILETIDHEITDGPFKGSSFVLFSRNPFMLPRRELPVIGGRGAFRMAQGFAYLRTVCVNCVNSGNPSKGDIIEYNVTLFHY
ncbi:dirigent protein 4 [Brachypodium distachyon]|uniref:Dirigent protein n=1 Tax=Brachypodium distachyon TaxID=15368 RepID=I1HUY6_BRADI|nr:dirigent protein 4 [Brachypodium distachyon]KQK11400.1 hypothetical protein BRADI_2g59970v3 [Brachypodium distachyon]|eukprot:XP_003567441.1 dirigent protein 4 [Brachypodium distachyon]